MSRTAVALGLLLLGLLGGCFSPSFGEGQFDCGPAPERACPPGYSCGPGNRCYAGADPGQPDTGPPRDAPRRDGEDGADGVDATLDRPLADVPGPDAVTADAPPPADLPGPDGPVVVPGETCGAAPIVGPGSYPGSTRGRPAQPPGGCLGADGPRAIYGLLVPPGQRLEVAVQFEASVDGTVEIHGGPTQECDQSTCLEAADDDGPGVTEQVSFTHGGQTERLVYIVVSSFGPVGGDYTAILRLVPVTSGETCDTAQVIVPGFLAGESTVGLSNDFISGPGCRGTRGRDRVYRIEVPPLHELDVSAIPTDGNDLSVNLVLGPDPAACTSDPHICVEGNNDAAAGEPERARYVHNGSSDGVSASRTVFIIVDSAALDSPGGTYDLDVALKPVQPPGPGEACQSAIQLFDGDSEPGELVGSRSDYGQDPTCATQGGPDRAYRIDVPPLTGLRAEVVPAPGLDPTLSLVAGPDPEACDQVPRNCLASLDDQPVSLPEVLLWDNTELVTRTVFLIVDGFGPGSYTLNIAFN